MCVLVQSYPPPGLQPERSDIMPTAVPLEVWKIVFIGTHPPCSCTPVHTLAYTRVTFFLSFFWSFFDIVFNPLLERFWCQLAPNLASKIDPKSIQDPPKIDSKLYLVSSTFLNRFLIDFGSNLGPSNPPFTCKKQWFLKIFMILLACLLDGFWSQLGSILGGFWEPSWHQIAPKVDAQRYQKNDHLLDRSWKQFWWILASIWGAFFVSKIEGRTHFLALGTQDPP